MNNGNFKTDKQKKYLFDLITHLRQKVEVFFSGIDIDTDVEPEVFLTGEFEVITSIDLLTLLWSHYEIPLNLDLKTLRQWRDIYLKLTIQNLENVDTPDTYAYKRYHTVKQTFEELEDLLTKGTV